MTLKIELTEHAYNNIMAIDSINLGRMPYKGIIMSAINAIKHGEVQKEQEPREGYWYIDERPESDREVVCSKCEQPVFNYHKLDFDYRPKYCPNCGCRMSEVSE